MMTSYDVTKWKCRPKGENNWFLFDDVIGISRIGEMKMKKLSSTTQYDSIDTKTKVSLLMVKILWKICSKHVNFRKNADFMTKKCWRQPQNDVTKEKIWFFENFELANINCQK